jgi:ERCC4-related helicase/ERCC4-type nuclease
MLKNFEPRLYQETIFATTLNHNVLCVLPTGLGKTALAMMLAGQRLQQYPNSKILILTPTKPLCQQHYDTFSKYLDIDLDKVAFFTGNVRPSKREEMWKDAKVIISTPQGLTNDVISRKINLNDISLLVFDECHRATGEYDYVWLAKKYNKDASHPKILGLTASPGSDLEKISEICKNLYIDEIEVRTQDDPDVKPYVQDVKTEWLKVALPDEFLVVKKFLEDCFKSKLEDIKKLGYLNSAQFKYGTKMELLRLQGGLHAQIAQGDRSYEILKTISLSAEAMKVQHGLELIETQGVSALNMYLNKLESQAATSKVKAVQNLVRDINFRSAVIKTKALIDNNVEHPKLDLLKKLIIDEIAQIKDGKIIIFTQYRDTATKVKAILDSVENVESKIFVGQQKKGTTGITQKKQIEILDQFRNNEFNVIIMTSVGEEGLDIPQVDRVVFYEPVPSAIRTIQRKGRTGRHDSGKVYVLMTQNTRDEAYRWSAHHKEKKMYRLLEDLKTKLKTKNLYHTNTVRVRDLGKGQASLASYGEQKMTGDKIQVTELKIYVDYREKSNPVVKELLDLGLNVKLETLHTGDYLASSDVVVEYKTTQDFVNSIIDGRLLQQIKSMKEGLQKPVLIVEGVEDIYSIRKIHPNAIRGMIATIAVSYSVPIIYTKNARETANLLYFIVKREQENTEKDFSYHANRKPSTLREQQEYFISSLPNVGSNLAKHLLKAFKSVSNVVNASEDDLKKVDKVGEKKSSLLRKLFDEEYKSQ